MRFQFIDSSTWTPPATSVFELVRVRLDLLTAAANKRDLYFRVLAHAAQGYLPRIYATGTKAQANAITVELGTNALRIAAGVLAYADLLDPITAPWTIVLTDQTGTNPDLSGLAVQVNGTPPTPSAAWNYVGGYVASPANEVLSKIKALLVARMGAGQILEGFTAAEITTCHDQMTILSTSNQITGVHVSQNDLPVATGYYGKEVHYSVIIGRLRPDEESGYTDLITIGDSVWSLLGDEERDLDGLISTHKVEGMEGPTPINGEDGTYQAVRINGVATFPMMYSDI
jgi:hypothetical protein